MPIFLAIPLLRRGAGVVALEKSPAQEPQRITTRKFKVR